VLWRAFRVCLSCRAFGEFLAWSSAGRSVERYKLNLRFVHQRSRPSVCCYDRFMRILTLFTLPYFTFLYFTLLVLWPQIYTKLTEERQFLA